MAIPVRTAVIPLILIFLIAVPSVTAGLPGDPMIVRPGYDTLRDDPPDTVVKISFWELTPRSMVVFTLFAISPVLVLPAELFFAVKVYSLLGIRRLTNKVVLENERRKIIYRLVQQNPGSQLSTIVSDTNMNRGTARYHLAMLELAGKITHVTFTGHSLYYETKTGYSRLEKQVLWHLQSESRTRILIQLLRSPSGSRPELAAALGISRPSVTWHMQQLVGDEIVSVKKEGTTVTYELNPDAVPVVRKYLDGPAGS